MNVLAVIILCLTCTQLTECQTSAGNGFLQNMVNSLQLGLKNIIDRFVTDVDMPKLPESLGDIEFPDITIPPPLGGGYIFTGCPKCYPADAEQLVGVWHLMYANDNFIRNHLMRIARAEATAAAAENVQPLSNGGFDPLGHVRLGNSITLKTLTQPAKLPTCIRLDIGNSIDFGFVRDFPFLMRFHEGVPRGKEHQIFGKLRQTTDGKVMLMVAGSDYVIRLCLTESNIRAPITRPTINEPSGSEFPSLPVVAGQKSAPLQSKPSNRSKGVIIANLPPHRTPQEMLHFFYSNGTPPGVSLTDIFQPVGQQNISARANISKTIHRNKRYYGRPRKPRNLQPQWLQQQQQPVDTTSKYIIFADTSGFPGCQNYAVFSTDQWDYFEHYDHTIMEYIERQRANDNANPLQYTGCPYVMEQMEPFL